MIAYFINQSSLFLCRDNETRDARPTKYNIPTSMVPRHAHRCMGWSNEWSNLFWKSDSIDEWRSMDRIKVIRSIQDYSKPSKRISINFVNYAYLALFLYLIRHTVVPINGFARSLRRISLYGVGIYHLITKLSLIVKFS